MPLLSTHLTPAICRGSSNAGGVSRMAQNLVALTQAPEGEDYNGPVLFEGPAGPQIFAEVLGRIWR